MTVTDPLILIADDVAPVREDLKNHLNEMGIENVIQAVDGSDAIEKIEAYTKLGKKFDLIISDWMMPKYSGLELFSVLQTKEATRGVPFLILTAKNEAEQVIEAISLGISDYIIKPLNSKILASKVRTLLSRRAKK